MMRILSTYFDDGQGWFRVLGVGLSWKNTKKHPLSFSERLGKRKGLRIGKYIIHGLS